MNTWINPINGSKNIKDVVLDSVVALAISEAVDFSNFSKITFHIVSENVTTGAIVKLQHSLDGINYVDVFTANIATSCTNEICIENRKYKYLRVNITSYTDGTYTIGYIAGV